MTSVAILVFDGMTALDAIGPYESMRRLPGVSVYLVGLTRTAVTVEGQGFEISPRLEIDARHHFDVLLIPGGGNNGLLALLEHKPLIEWIRAVHAETRWTASVCTGAFVLAAAGLLEGMSVSTHWRAANLLEQFGLTYSSERISEKGKIITAAGVTAGLDLGLHLCALLSDSDLAKAVQLSMQYDPEPPFDTGTPDKAGAHITQLASTKLQI